MKKNKIIKKVLAKQSVSLEKMILLDEIKIVARPQQHSNEFDIYLKSPTAWFKFKTMNDKEVSDLVRNIKSFVDLLK